MMKRILVLLVMLGMLLITFSAYAQGGSESSFVFSVKAGPDLQAAQFGLPMGSIQPYIGIDYLSLGAKFKEEGGEIKMSSSLIIPYAGAKLFLSMAKPSKPYVFGSFFKSFASMNLEAEGESLLGDDIDDFIKDLLSFWGLKIGFGAEYAVSDHFSVGGEFGMKMYFLGGDLKAELPETAYTPATEIESEISASLKETFVAVVLNFYL